MRYLLMTAFLIATIENTARAGEARHRNELWVDMKWVDAPLKESERAIPMPNKDAKPADKAVTTTKTGSTVATATKGDPNQYNLKKVKPTNGTKKGESGGKGDGEKDGLSMNEPGKKEKSTAGNGVAGDKKGATEYANGGTIEGLLNGESITKIRTRPELLAVGVKSQVLGNNGQRLNGAAVANAPGTQVTIQSPAGAITGTIVPRATMQQLASTATAYSDPSVPFTAIRGGSTATMFALQVDRINGQLPAIRRLGVTNMNYYAPTNAEARAAMRGGPNSGFANILFMYHPDGTVEPLGGGQGGGQGGQGATANGV